MQQLVEAQTEWNEREHAARSPDDDDEESRQPTNPYKMLMRQLYGWIAREPVTRRAVRRARRTTRGHRVCSRSSGPVTGSWGCAARCTTVSEPPTSTAPKDWANVTTPSTRPRSWRCSPIVGAEVERTACSVCLTQPC